MLLAGLLVFALGAGGLVVLRVFGDRDRNDSAVVVTPSPAPASSAPAVSDDGSSSSPVPAGTEAPVSPLGATSDCQAPDSIDASGATTSYEPAHVIDGLPDTAWRCAGSAVGTRIDLDLGHAVTLTQLGLIPGYAKRDQADGAYRFTQNRTVTEVRWDLLDGSGSVVGSADQPIPTPRPETAWSRLPGPITASQVRLTILRTGNPAPQRDFTAISEIELQGLSNS